MAIIGDPDARLVKTLLETDLVIPDYQRPYKWQARHVNQLMDDVLVHRRKTCYRLGTVVLHVSAQGENKTLNIVDGQQRLLTLTLLVTILDTRKICKPKLLSRPFSSLTSIKNLRHNAAVIESRCKQLSETDREELIDFVLHKCELICLQLDDLNEAFQFFDSQNARGKELAPYDLLKAFHLREMTSNTEQERLECVSYWESDISPDDALQPSLQSIMSDYLFRIRCWTKGCSGAFFDKTNVHVFKGVNLNATPYRFTKPMLALDYMVDQYNDDSIRQWDQHLVPYPFQIDQTILNGKRFFQYIQQYIELYQQLFLADFTPLKPIMDVINEYDGRHRVGDHYVRNLFCCAVFYYYDKFADVELDKAAVLCFIWSYRIRLTQQRVPIESIDNQAMGRSGIFFAIKKALHPHEVLAYPIELVKLNDIRGTKVDDIKDKFNGLGYLQS